MIFHSAKIIAFELVGLATWLPTICDRRRAFGNKRDLVDARPVCSRHGLRNLFVRGLTIGP